MNVRSSLIKAAAEALVRGFDWHTSVEGHEYWRDIHTKLEALHEKAIQDEIQEDEKGKIMLDWTQRHGDLQFPGSIHPSNVKDDETTTVFLDDFEWRALNHLLDCAANTKTADEYYVQKEKILQVFYDNLTKGRE